MSYFSYFQHYSVDIWFQSPRDISQKLAAYQHSAMRTGQVDFAMLALGCLCQYSVLGGENLSLLQQSYGDRVKLAVSGIYYFAVYLVYLFVAGWNSIVLHAAFSFHRPSTALSPHMVWQ
jgi:hypothetical protein